MPRTSSTCDRSGSLAVRAPRLEGPVNLGEMALNPLDSKRIPVREKRSRTLRTNHSGADVHRASASIHSRSVGLHESMAPALTYPPGSYSENGRIQRGNPRASPRARGPAAPALRGRGRPSGSLRKHEDLRTSSGARSRVHQRSRPRGRHFRPLLDDRRATDDVVLRRAARRRQRRRLSRSRALYYPYVEPLPIASRRETRASIAFRGPPILRGLAQPPCARLPDIRSGSLGFLARR